MNLAEHTIMRKVLREKLRELDAITPCCLHCIHLQGRICTKFESEPPPSWVQGPVDCAEWTYDNVPF